MWGTGYSVAEQLLGGETHCKWSCRWMDGTLVLSALFILADQRSVWFLGLPQAVKVAELQ